MLGLIAAGRTNGEIAERLGITLDGAKWHVSEILAIFDVQSREEAVDIWQSERSLGSRIAHSVRALLLPVLAHKTLAAGAAATVVIVAGAAGIIVERSGVMGASTPASPTAVAALGQSLRLPQYWRKSGSDWLGYDMGVDPAVQFGSRPSISISGPAGVVGTGTLMQDFRSDDYRGKRLRLSAMVRSAGVTGWAGIWLRVDGQASGQPLALDDMQNRPIVGTTDWTPYSVVLDVDQSSVDVAFGVLLGGTGQIWASDLRIEVVGRDVAVTDLLAAGSTEPLNLDFSQTSPASGSLRMPDHWGRGSSAATEYEMGVDPGVQFGSRASAVLSGPAGASGTGTLSQHFKADQYRGKRVQLSAEVRAAGVTGWAGLWLRVDGQTGATLAFDNMQDRPIAGTSDWGRYSVVLDVKDSASQIAFGFLLSGPGQVWISDARLEPVGNEVASTDLIPTLGPLSSGTPTVPPSASGPLNLDFSQ